MPILTPMQKKMLKNIPHGKRKKIERELRKYGPVPGISFPTIEERLGKIASEQVKQKVNALRVEGGQIAERFGLSPGIGAEIAERLWTSKKDLHSLSALALDVSMERQIPFKSTEQIVFYLAGVAQAMRKK